MTSFRIAVTATAAVLSWTFAHAETALFDLATRDACTPVYAVQKRGCVQQRFYRCDHDGRTIQRAESISIDGIYYIDFTDLDGNTIQSWSRSGQNDTVGVVEIRDLFSQAEMAKNGEDSFDYTTLSTNQWFAEPVPEKFSAEIQLTGTVLSVDGVDFVEARFRGYTQINSYRREIDRFDYFDLETGAFLWGGDVPAGKSTSDENSYEPVRVLFPDDPEFDVDGPAYDCEMVSSLAPLKPAGWS